MRYLLEWGCQARSLPSSTSNKATPAFRYPGGIFDRALTLAHPAEGLHRALRSRAFGRDRRPGSDGTKRHAACKRLLAFSMGKPSCPLLPEPHMRTPAPPLPTPPAPFPATASSLLALASPESRRRMWVQLPSPAPVVTRFKPAAAQRTDDRGLARHGLSSLLAGHWDKPSPRLK